MANTLTITISSTSAGDLTEEVNANTKIGLLKSAFMAKKNLDPLMADKYVLVSKGGKILSDDDTLEEAGVLDGAVLLLEPKQPEVVAVGAAPWTKR